MDAEMISHCTVEDEREATALLVDLRNFTPNLNASKPDENGVSRFCRFVSQFYGMCLDTCLIALPPQLRDNPPVYLNSTGDGVLVVFINPEHVRSGFLAAVLLHQVLRSSCSSYTESSTHDGCPNTSFGIGIESGSVNRITACRDGNRSHLIFDTYIGQCINVAARAEAQTKTFFDTQTIVASRINQLLCKDLYDKDYAAFVAEAFDMGIDDRRRIDLHKEMNELNQSLCLHFLYHFSLKGVVDPIPLFRFANTAMQPGNRRFDALIRRLAVSESHYDSVVKVIERANSRVES